LIVKFTENTTAVPRVKAAHLKPDVGDQSATGRLHRGLPRPPPKQRSQQRTDQNIKRGKIRLSEERGITLELPAMLKVLRTTRADVTRSRTRGAGTGFARIDVWRVPAAAR
jgi:hypothetical protein